MGRKDNHNNRIEDVLKEILISQHELKVLISERTKQIDNIEQKVKNLEDKIDALDKVSASGQTIIKIFSIVFTAVLTFLVGYLLKLLS